MTIEASALPLPSLTLLQDALSLYFAPWVQDLKLQVLSAEKGLVTLQLPVAPTLAREGGSICGQALMSAGDTAMVLALMTHFGEFKPCTTVQLSSSFLRPLHKQDGLVTAQVVRAGRSLAFGEIDIRGADDGKSVCRVSTTYALL